MCYLRFRVTHQVPQSDTMLTLLERGISPPYLDRPDAGWIRRRDGRRCSLRPVGFLSTDDDSAAHGENLLFWKTATSTPVEFVQNLYEWEDLEAALL